MDKKKLITFLLALTMILSLAVGASAAEMTEARVPVTLTVVNTVFPISCTVPACLPVSLVDGYVVCANNATITNTGKIGAIKVTKVDVQAGTFEIGNFDDFTASKNSIALSINGCSTKGAGSLALVDGAFPAIAAEKNLAIRYKAKVSASEAVTNVNAATVIFRLHNEEFQKIHRICAGSLYAVFTEHFRVCCGENAHRLFDVDVGRQRHPFYLRQRQNCRIHKRGRSALARNAGKHHKRKI